jgi:hypothetical protein
MTGKVSFTWVLATAVCLSSCGGSTTSQYQDPPATAPSGLSYPDPNLFTQGVTIVPLVPVISGGAPTTYSVEPPLPAGLVLNTHEGIISGTPMEVRSPETYLVTAENATGSSLFGVRITVLGRYSVGGVVTGLTGTGLVLTNNGADTVTINANGEFAFSRLYPAAAGFSISVSTQPTGQTCSISQGSGVLTNSNYRDAIVSCAAIVNKAIRAGRSLTDFSYASVTGNVGGTPFITCFYPPSPEPIRGYVINQATGALTTLGDLIHAIGAAPDTPLPEGCALNLVTLDSSGRWAYVVSSETKATYIYSLQ